MNVVVKYLKPRCVKNDVTRLLVVLILNIDIITFAKEVMYCPSFVCLYVCLLATLCAKTTEQIYVKILSLIHI